MDRLAEQVVDWHNRHPLAKRITIYDVHTIGVVALPFMRSGGGALGGMGQIEPVLSNEVSAESLEAADWHEGTTVAAELHPNAAHLDALADHEAPSGGKRSPLAMLRALVPLLLRKRSKVIWPVFSDRIIENLSVKQIAHFADEYGYATRPGDATWPLRTAAVDDALVAQSFGDGGGAWPCELYVKSAAIDAGNSRTRVLIGRGGLRPPVLGRRCMDPKRLGAAALVALLLIGVPAWLLWPHGEPAGEAPHAASAPLPVTPAPSKPAMRPLPASEPALAASSPASSAVAAIEAGMSASMPASAAATPEPAASQAPDIRPQILPMQGGRTRGGKPITNAPSIGSEIAAEQGASKPASALPEEKPGVKPPLAAAVAAAAAAASAPPSMSPIPRIVVALVGPASKDKAEADKLLAVMLALAEPTMPAAPSLAGSAPVAPTTSLQSQVFMTPEGWRPAIYPFSSREQAQLINANLVAHGLHTKAINF